MTYGVKINEGREEMSRIADALAVAGVALSILPAVSAGTASEGTLVFVRPEASSFWRTAEGPTITVPVVPPDGAASATLTVSGADYSKSYANVAAGEFSFEVPQPTGPESENVYDLTLSFDDGTVRSAKLGLISGLSPGPEGATRCIAPQEARSWGRVNGGRVVLPIPYGVTSFTVGGVETATGLGGAQGWFALGGIGSGGGQALALTADGVESSATLYGPTGLFMLIR